MDKALLPSLNDLLREMRSLEASDLHLTAGAPPLVRVDGALRALSQYRVLAPADIENLCRPLLTGGQKERLERELQLDLSFAMSGVARFRANLFHQRGALAATFRGIPFEAQSFAELGLPAVMSEICDLPHGLVLVTGPTGSGKTTTLAAIVDKINTDRADHILTIEDPIEFLHEHKKGLVNQREVDTDTRSFAEALRVAPRQDPDVVLIGEMRDLDSISAALSIAETGHLTLATLHTNTAVSTINRIIDVFPAGQQAQVRAQLALTLEAIFCQSLLPRAAGPGRVLAVEVLIASPAVRNLIRECKEHQIYSLMQTGQERYSMQTFNQALAALCASGLITRETAFEYSAKREELQELLSRQPAVARPLVTTAGPVR